jgi:hypothetical protein
LFYVVEKNANVAIDAVCEHNVTRSGLSIAIGNPVSGTRYPVSGIRWPITADR